MARPQKKGLDYFPHDTTASESRELRYIESLYGLQGYAVYLKILERIYGQEGYFCSWEEIDARIFAAEWSIDYDVLRSIIQSMLEINLFTKWIFEAHGVLTSKSIQTRYQLATSKRATVKILDNYRFQNNTSGVVSASETTPEPTVSVAESTQSKVKESKGKKRIKTLSASGDAAQADEPFFLTRKKRKLKGKSLETFEQFWAAFDYKRGKAEAADAWLDIPSLPDSAVALIIRGAEAEALSRPELVAMGRTPKMAQGWLSARRWEDENNKTDGGGKNGSTDWEGIFERHGKTSGGVQPPDAG